MFARVGAGVDGRPSGRDAVALASLLARATGAELMLIAVFEEPVLATVVPAEMGWTSERSQARAMLAATRESLAPGARMVVQSDALVWRGLRNAAHRGQDDLLVVGSGHGATDGKVELGQRSEELLRHLECPLALAPKGTVQRGSKRLERIGVGFDGEAESRAALQLAGSIAVTARAELEVRGIVDHRGPGGVTTEQMLPGGDAIVADRTKALLNEALVAAGATGASVRVDVIPGNPLEALLSLGAGVDLLVIGSGKSASAYRVRSIRVVA